MEKILERLKKGDINAFVEMVNLYDLKLYYIALSRVKEEKIAREVVQDTFVDVYLNLRKIKRVKNFNAWIIKILINNCNKKFKKKKFTEVSYEEINASIFLHEDERIIHLIDSMTFIEMIDFLDETDRTIMTLYYRDEHTTKQISEILNINENTVRIRIMRARKAIKKRIEGDFSERG